MGYSKKYKKIINSGICPECGGVLAYRGMYDLYCVGEEKEIDGYIQVFGNPRHGCGFNYVDDYKTKLEE